LSIKPEHETRRKIIREWMSLPKDKRQTEEQAKPFAKKAMERIPSSGDPYRQILRWLLPASVSRDPSEGGSLVRSQLVRAARMSAAHLDGRVIELG
jgi:hypothetical protein